MDAGYFGCFAAEEMTPMGIVGLLISRDRMKTSIWISNSISSDAISVSLVARKASGRRSLDLARQTIAASMSYKADLVTQVSGVLETVEGLSD